MCPQSGEDRPSHASYFRMAAIARIAAFFTALPPLTAKELPPVATAATPCAARLAAPVNVPTALPGGTDVVVRN